MFRKMRRFKQQLSEECISILEREPRGILSMMGDDGYPYGIPLDHYYNPENGKLYFHCAPQGKKVDSLRLNHKVSYCVHDEGFRKPGEWALNIKSVVCFGTIREFDVDDREFAIEMCRALGHKFTSDAAYIENDIRRNYNKVKVLELTIDHMTGKLVNES